MYYHLLIPHYCNRFSIVSQDDSTHSVEKVRRKLLTLMTITRERKSDYSGRQTGGAVTHVLVNDPTRGYGIFIENMLDAAG